MSLDSQPLRNQLTDFLVTLSDIIEDASRRSVLSAAGFARLQDRINFRGCAREFVDWDGGLLDAFAAEGQAQLAIFLGKLLDAGVLSRPLGVSDVQRLQGLVGAVQALSPKAWKEQFPVTDRARRERVAQSISSNASATLSALRHSRARRVAAAGVAAPLEPNAIGDEAIWGYDLIPQENAFKTPFSPMPRHGIFSYTASDNPQLLETYVIARMEHCLRDELKRTLSEDKKLRIVLTEADLADADQALAVVNRALQASGRKQLFALVAKKGPDCFMTIVNANAQSAHVQPFMLTLAQQVTAQIGPTVLKNNLYLIILWVDRDQGPPRQQPLFSSVPPVELFTDRNSVVGWLDRVLLEAGVVSGRRRTVCDGLRKRLNSPVPWDVFEALRTTVDEFREGRI
ncbi:MAG: hypothetical protein AB9869_23605 [Verrucomicrobiia bacterium]